jgi:ABC-type multidrug transport system ATPase subunit
VNFSVKTFLTERVEETLSGYTAAVAINLFGNDLDVLDEKAQGIARVLGDVPGATDVQIQSPPSLPQLTIRLRKPDLERWGFDAVEVLDQVRAAYQGDVVGQTYQGNQVFNVITILDTDSRSHVTQVGSLPLRSPGGAYVLLKQIADVFESPGRYQVLHEGARRLQTVTANVAGSDVAAFVQAARAAIAAKVQLPAGTYLQFAGTAEAQAQSQRDLTVNVLVAGLGIVLLLSIITRNWRNLLLVLANLPFAMVGGVLAVFATGGVLSLGGMVGFVTLLGITLRNSILMIAHYEHLVEGEGMTWGLDAAVRGAGDRLTPILMTSIVTALGILPLAIGAGDAGREIEGPMALVILGGLLTSMALNLVVLPILALRFGRFEPAIDEFSSDVVGVVRKRSDRSRLPLRQTLAQAIPSLMPLLAKGPHEIQPQEAQQKTDNAIHAIMPTPAGQNVVACRRPDDLARAKASVRVDGLSKSYGRIHALENVGFSIRAGEILGLIGPNGAGKTTLFECVAGLEAADRGDVSFGDPPGNVRRRSSELFYVPDGIAPWPDQPVRWVLEYCLGFFGGRQEIYEQVIVDLALAPLMRVPICALSKGQRKRTLLALGLLAPQPILLIDEPFEGLDLRQSREAAATLRRHITPDRTFFLSIHQIVDAAKVCDRFVLLSGGRVAAEGTLDVLTAVARQRAGHNLPPDFEEVFLALT